MGFVGVVVGGVVGSQCGGGGWWETSESLASKPYSCYGAASMSRGRPRKVGGAQHIRLAVLWCKMWDATPATNGCGNSSK